jgi:hypothetical protein
MNSSHNNVLQIASSTSLRNSLAATLRFVNENMCIEGDSNGSKSSYGPVIHSHIWIPYSLVMQNLGLDRVTVFCEHGNDFVSIKGGAFLSQLSSYQLLKTDCSR